MIKKKSEKYNSKNVIKVKKKLNILNNKIRSE
jgi:hypothetical protein